MNVQLAAVFLRIPATVHVAARLHPRLDHAEAILRVQARRGKCNIMGQGHPSPGAALDCAKYASATQISARRSSKRSKLYTFATTQMRKTQIEFIVSNKASARA